MLLNQITVRKSPACREGSTNGKNYSEEVFTTTLAVSHHHDNYSWSARVPTISSWLDSSSRNAVRSFILQPQHNMTRGLAPPHQKVWSITRVKAFQIVPSIDQQAAASSDESLRAPLRRFPDPLPLLLD